jgi:hypothetical protein
MRSNLLFLLGALIASNSLAAATFSPLERGWYFGYSIGASKSDTNPVSGYAITREDETLRESRAFAGKRLTDHFAAELGFEVTDQKFAAYNSYPASVSMRNTDISILFYPKERGLHLRLGVVSSEARGDGGATASSWGLGSVWGLGYDIPVGPMDIRLSAQKYSRLGGEPDENKAGMSVGVVLPIDEPQSARASLSTGRLSISPQVAYLRYSEPAVSVKHWGYLSGVGVIYDFDRYDSRGISIEGRYLQGAMKYNSPTSGSLGNLTDELFESRAVYSLPSLTSRESLKVSIGVGYRRFYDDSRGLSTANAAGYRRLSQYLYVPLILKDSFVWNDHRFRVVAEYDYLQKGRQKSYLQDNTTRTDRGAIVNDQRRGAGLRLSLLASIQGWEIGPFFEQWRVADSDRTVAYGSSWYEPKNKTTMFGLTAVKSF